MRYDIFTNRFSDGSRIEWNITEKPSNSTYGECMAFEHPGNIVISMEFTGLCDCTWEVKIPTPISVGKLIDTIYEFYQTEIKDLVHLQTIVQRYQYGTYNLFWDDDDVVCINLLDRLKNRKTCRFVDLLDHYRWFDGFTLVVDGNGRCAINFAS